jgi:hypothetical protein
MKKLTVTLMLVLTTAPALAAVHPQTHQTQNNGHAVSVPERHRHAQGERSDPYWIPCDYSKSYGPDACGGD